LRIGHLRFCFAVCLIGTFISAGVALADWDVGDPALYYQLPNANGWDVYSEWGTGPLASEGYGAANDWTADTTAPITDIHFWGSWKNDVVGDTGRILIQIFSNDTSDPTFPRPDELLWSNVFEESEYTGRLYTTGDQGWYDPRFTDEWYAHNHDNMYQYNIPMIDNPFIQQAGQTYWLMISMDFEGCEWGWKTTETVEGNPSVFWDSYYTYSSSYPYWYRHPTIEWRWQQLREGGWCYPHQSQPLDLAFVLTTPEPATLFLMAFGAAAMLRKRRK
jgi:hypothetical protein